MPKRKKYAEYNLHCLVGSFDFSHQYSMRICPSELFQVFPYVVGSDTSADTRYCIVADQGGAQLAFYPFDPGKFGCRPDYWWRSKSAEKAK
jgi:hypothetical protein